MEIAVGVVVLVVVLTSTTLAEDLPQLRDDCIAQVQENGEYYTSTFRDSLSLLLSPSSNRDPRITLRQGNSEGTKSWTPRTSEQKWYHVNFSLNEQPQMFIAQETIAFDRFESPVMKRKWDVRIENVDYCTDCPGGMPIIAVYSSLDSSSVFIPRSDENTEKLQILPSQSTGFRMTVGGVGVRVCREGKEGGVVVREGSDNDTCHPLLPNTPTELHITFESETVQLGMEGRMTSFPLRRTAEKSVEVDKAVNGSVYIIHCLQDRDTTPNPGTTTTSTALPPTTTTNTTTTGCEATDNNNNNSNNNNPVLTVFMVLFLLTSIALTVYILHSKKVLPNRR